MLDENLLSRSPTAIVDTEPYRSFIRSARMFNLDDGSAWLFFVLQVHTVQAIGKEFSVYLQHIDVYGRVSTPIKFVDDLCKDFSEVTVTKMKDRFYCVNVTCRESVRTKCVIFQWERQQIVKIANGLILSTEWVTGFRLLEQMLSFKSALHNDILRCFRISIWNFAEW